MERIVPLDSALGWAFRALQLEWSGRWHQSARVRGDSIKSPAEDHEGSHSRFGGRFGEDVLLLFGFSIGHFNRSGREADRAVGAQVHQVAAIRPGACGGSRRNA